MSGSTLKIQGDGSSDWISVDITNDRVWFSGTGLSVQSKSTSEVSGIDIGGKAGNDTIDVRQTAAFPRSVRVFGDTGNDLIRMNLRPDGVRYAANGGNARYWVDGGSGNDNLNISQWMPTGTDGRTSGFYTGIESRSFQRLASAQLQLRQNSRMSSIWYPIDAPIRNESNARSAGAYRQVIEQFESGRQHQRYAEDRSGTKCNIFAGDVMKAMGVPLPTKRDLDGGNAQETAGAVVLNRWLNGSSSASTGFPNGPQSGWRKISINSQAELDLLLQHVKAGRPALASTAWTNHIAVIRPDQALTRLTQSNLGALIIAQAGKTNFNRGTLADVDGWRNEYTRIDYFVADVASPPKSGSSVVYLSDLPFVGTPDNGWGPVERDRSNGEMQAGDGRSISLQGKAFPKGLGVHSNSRVVFNLGRQYSRFTSVIGVDDESGNRGSVRFTVLGDSRVLFQSGVMRGDSPNEFVDVNVSGIQQLQLIVDNAGDGFDSDHASWGDAKLESGTTTYVSDMPFVGTPVNGWGAVERDRSNGEAGSADGRTISLQGKTFTRGLGVHSYSRVTIDLGGSYTRFTSVVGIDDEVGDRGSVRFFVLADGKILFQSSLMRGSSPNEIIDLDVTGKHRLELIVDNGGDGDNSDHASWGNAKLSRPNTFASIFRQPSALRQILDNLFETTDLDRFWSFRN